MPFRLPTPVLLALLAAAVATLLALGVWQVRRAAWKADLVAARNASLAGQPLTADEARELPPEALDYRLVALGGRWDMDHAMILANRARYGVKGENVVVPLVTGPGEAVLVDRGWYPERERDAALARLRAEAGATGVVRGLARYAADATATRTPAGTWTGLAPASMATGLPERLAPWTVIEGPLLPADGGPQPTTSPAQGFLPYVNTTPHVEYAFTWFGIAGSLVVIAIFRLVLEPRRAARRAAESSEASASR